MRKGQNPAKLGIPAYQPHRLGVAVLSFIPTLEGYFADSLAILKVQIESLRASTPGDFDLFVFDNGSCAAVQAELQALLQAGRIDWLLASRHNLGKTGALNWIFGAMPNEWIVYADSDVLFRRGWLEASLKIREAFPAAGMISAQPAFFDVLHGEGTAHRQLAGEPGNRLGERKLPAAVVNEYCQGIGAPPERAEGLREQPVPVVSKADGSVEAVVGATHMQFLIERELARQILPLPATRGLASEEDRALDERIDRAGRLHLSTLEPLVYHMGNRLDEDLAAEIQRDLGGAMEPGREARKSEVPAGDRGWLKLFESLSRFRPFQKRLQRIYHLLFEYYAQR
ncbi:MAG TPA: glycosyltransferase family A protein [Anaerolineaceae bacterium]|nr:glycosyltransferase family A protein [Anaerolineaceae bacterium]